MYCQQDHKGIKSIGFTAMHQKDEKGQPIPDTFDYDFWVCAACMKPTRMVFQEMTNGLAPLRATGVLSANGHGDGRWTIRWSTEVAGETVETMTFTAYPREMKMLHDQGRNVCLELWERLDIKIDTIRGGTSLDPEATKAEATELATVISIIMGAFYEDAKAVLVESMTRWTCRQNGTADGHQTPGLAERHWQPVRVTAPANRTPALAVKMKVQFDAQKITFIKHSLENGIMPAEQLAKMFECTVEDIKGALDA